MVLLTLGEGGISYVGFSVVTFCPMAPCSDLVHASGDPARPSPPGRDAGPGGRVSGAKRRRRPHGREERVVGRGEKGAPHPGGGGRWQQQQ